MSFPTFQQLLEYLSGPSALQGELSATELQTIVNSNSVPVTPPPKIQLTEFNVDRFCNAIISNAFLVQGEKPFVVADLRTLIDCLFAARGKFAAANSESESLSVEFCLTVLLHMAKTLSVESRPHPSHFNWFVDKVVKKYFYSSSFLRPPVVYVSEAEHPLVTELWRTGNLMENLAELYYTAQLGFPEIGWSKENILACLSRMKVVVCSTNDEICGFTWLGGVALNLANLKLPLAKEFDATTQQSLIRAQFVVTTSHETGHYLHRTLLRDGDLNFSSPGSMKNAFLRSDTVDAHSSEGFAEFGDVVEKHLFGGVLALSFATFVPELESGLRNVAEHITSVLTQQRLALQSTAGDAGIAPKSPIILTPHQLEILAQCGGVSEESGTFGVKYKPRGGLYK